MTIDDPLRRARRSYILQSAIVLGVSALLIAVVTWKIAQAPQLGIWQLVIPAALWLCLLYYAWILRKYYRQLDANALEKYQLK